MSLVLSHGLGWENPHSSIVGCGRWPLKTIVRRNSFSVGRFIDKARPGNLPPMNLSTLLSLGLETAIQGLERRGKRPNGWRDSSLTIGSDSGSIDTGRVRRGRRNAAC